MAMRCHRSPDRRATEGLLAALDGSRAEERLDAAQVIVSNAWEASDAASVSRSLEKRLKSRHYLPTAMCGQPRKRPDRSRKRQNRATGSAAPTSWRRSRGVEMHLPLSPVQKHKVSRPLASLRRTILARFVRGLAHGLLAAGCAKLVALERHQTGTA